MLEKIEKLVASVCVILMAVLVEDIKLAYEKLENYRKGGKSNEEADESETDQLA